MKRLEKEVKQLQKEYNNISCELFSQKNEITKYAKDKVLK